MATIDIFPLSVGGVSPPLNLLSNIFSTQQSPKNFTYPLDLATNPTFAHAIQFSIFDYDYPGLKQSTSGFLESLSQTTGSIGDLANSFTSDPYGQTVQQQLSALSSSAGPTGSGILNLLQPQTWDMTVKTGAPRATISLYMPDTINTTYDSNYDTISMTDTLGLAGYIANALGDRNFKNTDFKNLPTNLAGSESVKQLAAMAAGSSGNRIGMKGGDLTGVLQQVFGQIPNPQMQLIYKGINLREFQFEFIFTPISSKEAATVDQIIKKFVYFSVPALKKTSGGQYLIPPQIFRINFAYTGGTGVMNAITNVFQNTLTNVVGSSLAGMLSGNKPGATSYETANSLNGSKLFTIGDCVLTNVNVDYAPNGWAAYGDGYPVQTRLTLQFKEMDIVTKDRVDPDQWKTDSSTTGPIPNNSNLHNSLSELSTQDPDVSAAVNILQPGPGGATTPSMGNLFGSLEDMPGSY